MIQTENQYDQEQHIHRGSPHYNYVDAIIQFAKLLESNMPSHGSMGQAVEATRQLAGGSITAGGPQTAMQEVNAELNLKRWELI